MPAPTSIAVYPSKPEFSRYITGYFPITGRVAFTGGTATGGDVLTLQLWRGAYMACSQTNVLTGSSAYLDFSVNQETAIVTTPSPDGGPSPSIYTATAYGQYVIIAIYSGSASLQAQSVPFALTLMPVAYLRSHYMPGISLVSGDHLEVTGGLQTPGITVEGFSSDHDLNNYILEYTTGSPPQLRWSRYDATQGRIQRGVSGKWINLPVAGFAQGVRLPDMRGNYMQVSIDSTRLPGAPTSDLVQLSPREFDDAMIREQVVLAQADLERDLQVTFEPQLYASRLADISLVPTGLIPQQIQSVDWAKPGYPEDLPTTLQSAQRLQIQLPLRLLIYIYGIGGRLGQQSIVTVPMQWARTDYRAGFIEVTPSGPGFMLGSPGGTGYYELLGTGIVEDFWHFCAWAGYDKLQTGVRSLLTDYLGMRAAIRVLVRAGMARLPGQSGQSYGVDGISESTQMLGGQYGPYSQLIQTYWDATHDVIGQPGQKNLWKLKNQMMGMAANLSVVRV